MLVALGACTSDPDETEVGPPFPRHIPVATGEPGAPVTLEHEAHAGDVLRVVVQPLPMTSCSQVFTLEGPSGDEIALTTLDPDTRIDEDGTWSWTYEPCPGDEVSYSLTATPLRLHELELDGPPVTLGVQATYRDGATFEPPDTGRAILLGLHLGLVGPDGARVTGVGTRVVFQDGLLVAPVAPETKGRYTVIGFDADVRLVSPPVFDAAVDGSPVALGPVGGREVGEYVVEFAVDEDSWLSTRLIGWATPPGGPDGVVVTPLDGQPDPTRSGGPWHLEPGSYAARVTAGEAGDHGSFALNSVVPSVIDGPGTFELTAGPSGAGLALFNLTGDHSITVVGAELGQAVGWSLTWAEDTPPKPCTSVISCMAVSVPTLPHDLALRPRISGSGYLALTSTDGGDHTVTVRIGAH
jgi:hypothetical protein